MQYSGSLSYTPVELTFGTSGLRGLVNDMTDVECYINTRGFLEFLRATDGLQAGETVYLAGDLRGSTPRIMSIVTMAINDAGLTAANGGFIPTPALAYYALEQDAPCIMVTGSHIPSDRNGIKFYKRGGEILKSDEAAIHENVAAVRADVYRQDIEVSAFTAEGTAKEETQVPAVDPEIRQLFIDRYSKVFANHSFANKQVVVYQHSAVGRDLIVEVLESLGANVVAIERSDVFVPIDTENVGEAEQRLFKDFSQRYPDAFAIVSTDGDSDRPFVIDEAGEFHRGDVLGLVVAEFLGTTFAATPISSNDAVDVYCAQAGIQLVHTKIGSPYVIEAMQAAPQESSPVGWEVNGGFLTGADITVEGGTLKALPTRDALLPILAALLLASKQGKKISELFLELPSRFTGGGLIDVEAEQINQFKHVAADEAQITQIAQKLFATTDLGTLVRVDNTDGLRMIFETGNVLHLRPSGNAPQFRVYTNTDTQQSANLLVAQAVASNGYIEQLLRAVTG